LTSHHNDLTIRPITGPDELDLFNQLPYQLNGELADDLDKGHRQPGRLWIALRDGRLAARAAWWARPGNEHPDALDILDLDDSGHPETVDIAARLLSTAMAEVIPEGTLPPYYLRFVDPGWRAAPATRQATEDRMAAAARTGAQLFVERLRLEWRPGGRRLASRPMRARTASHLGPQWQRTRTPAPQPVAAGPAPRFDAKRVRCGPPPCRTGWPERPRTGWACSAAWAAARWRSWFASGSAPPAGTARTRRHR
jgi:hypothetical protein